MSKIATQITKLQAAIAAAQATITGCEAKIAELQPQLEAEQAAARLAEEREASGYAKDTPVVITFGRGETRKTLAGVVVAFAPKNDKVPASYAVLVGSGIDAKIVKVPAVAVTLIEEQGA